MSVLPRATSPQRSELHLLGVPALRARRSQRVRDPPYARALHVQSELGQLTIIVADLCLVTSKMHAAVARTANIAPHTLHLCATHTHSATGCYWRGNLVERFMGPFAQQAYSQLVTQLARVGVDARSGTSEGRLSVSNVRLTGASVNRREKEGAVDQTLTLLKFNVESEQPICVVSFGAHAVGGVELEPFTMTADYPGEICRRLEACGYRSLFLLGAAGGTSPGWLSTSLDDHINRMGDAIQRGVQRAEEQLTPVRGSSLRARTIHLDASAIPCRLVPAGTRHKLLWTVLSWPVRTMVDAMARQGFQDNQELSLSFAQLGDVALLGWSLVASSATGG